MMTDYLDFLDLIIYQFLTGIENKITAGLYEEKDFSTLGSDLSTLPRQFSAWRYL